MGLISFTVNDRLRLNTAFGTYSSLLNGIITNRVKPIATFPHDEIVPQCLKHNDIEMT